MSSKKKKQKKTMLFAPPPQINQKCTKNSNNSIAFPLFDSNHKLNPKGILSNIGGYVHINKLYPLNECKSAFYEYSIEYISQNTQSFRSKILVSIKQKEALITDYAFICQYKDEHPIHYCLFGSKDMQHFVVLDEKISQINDSSVIHNSVKCSQSFQHFLLLSTSKRFTISYFEIYGSVNT